MSMQGFEISHHVCNLISHNWVQQTRDISSWTGEEKFHISKKPCIVVFLYKCLINMKKSVLFTFQKEYALLFIQGIKLSKTVMCRQLIGNLKHVENY